MTIFIFITGLLIVSIISGVGITYSILSYDSVKQFTKNKIVRAITHPLVFSTSVVVVGSIVLSVYVSLFTN